MPGEPGGDLLGAAVEQIGVGASQHRQTGGDPASTEDIRGRSFDASLGVVASHAVSRWLTIYGSPRLVLGVPVGATVTGHERAILDASVTAGGEASLSEGWALFVEAGLGVGWVFDRGPISDLHAVGGVSVRL